VLLLLGEIKPGEKAEITPLHRELRISTSHRACFANLCGARAQAAAGPSVAVCALDARLVTL
jgi:hypothetical protein